ncbi:TRIC cation channel family protein [Actinoallomurus sp. NBC_01490]|uniref:TRIC cation channel family protein n=1 Tax=Actinoallomurus sp. NBC_01490 TaxID=2903557 RepID=UPI002E31790A|nr:TRIC cation channel family protein [Actinoallomurus sp. NBC_01490]
MLHMTFAGSVQYSMDLIGIFAFALSGAFLPVRKDFDVFRTVILAEVAGPGDGLFRDLVLGIRPVAFTDVGYTRRRS